MYSGISGLRNFQTKLDVIGNNIANVNTAGFKKGRVTFKDMMSQTISGASASTNTRGGTNPMQVGLGSSIATIDTIHEGASLQSTNRSLDLGIDGDGYFVVRQGNSYYYTRAGNFYLDDLGTLVNGDGLPVQAFKLDENGNPTNEYGDVSINTNAVMPAQTTTQIILNGNLPSNAIASGTNVDGFIYSQQVKVVDKNGKAHVLDIYFKKANDNTWNVYINEDPKGTTTIATITFDNKGVPTNMTGGIFNNGKLSINTANNIKIGEDESKQPIYLALDNLILDVNKLTQLDGPATAIPDADGNTEGKIDSFNFGASGEINAVYSNGEIVTLGRLAIAKFSNNSGLMRAGNNLFQESINSGPANISPAGDGTGVIRSGTLEMSNVDLSEEFTEMIVAQRGFQANTRIITTSDEILQELVNLKR